MKTNGNDEVWSAPDRMHKAKPIRQKIANNEGAGTHTHVPRVLDRGDSDKAHGLTGTHSESLIRFDPSKLRGSGLIRWTHQRPSVDSCGAVEPTGAQHSDRP